MFSLLQSKLNALNLFPEKDLDRRIQCGPMHPWRVTEALYGSAGSNLQARQPYPKADVSVAQGEGVQTLRRDSDGKSLEKQFSQKKQVRNPAENVVYCCINMYN